MLLWIYVFHPQSLQRELATCALIFQLCLRKVFCVRGTPKMSEMEVFFDSLARQHIVFAKMTFKDQEPSTISWIADSDGPGERKIEEGSDCIKKFLEKMIAKITSHVVLVVFDHSHEKEGRVFAQCAARSLEMIVMPLDAIGSEKHFDPVTKMTMEKFKYKDKCGSKEFTMCERGKKPLNAITFLDRSVFESRGGAFRF